MAKHVVSLHQGAGNYQEAQGEIDLDLLRKYITYAKTKTSPRLGEEAGGMLKDFYVKDRQDSADQGQSSSGKRTGKIPITVRQLEAIIRMSESIAKMSLSPLVTPAHVEEAHRLFKISTLHAAKSGMSSSFTLPEELKESVKKVEEVIKRKFAIGTKLSYAKLQEELMRIFNNSRAIEYVRDQWVFNFVFIGNCINGKERGD